MKADLIDHMGSDLTVVNAARVSFDKESDFELDGLLKFNDIKLIRYLASHGHWTPFSHPQITMRETVPVFVARQRFKHTVGFSYNEVSRRYVDDEPEFYAPEQWRGKAANKKQGSSDETIPDFVLDLEDGPYFSYADVISLCTEWYNNAIEKGVAPEQARMVLPQSMFTSYYVTGSLAAWARAYKLRADSHAQIEIQELAAQWAYHIEKHFPVSWRLLVETE